MHSPGLSRSGRCRESTSRQLQHAMAPDDLRAGLHRDTVFGVFACASAVACAICAHQQRVAYGGPGRKKRTPYPKTCLSGNGCPYHLLRLCNPLRLAMPAPRTPSLNFWVWQDGEPKNYRPLSQVPATSVLNFRRARRLSAVRDHRCARFNATRWVATYTYLFRPLI